MCIYAASRARRTTLIQTNPRRTNAFGSSADFLVCRIAGFQPAGARTSKNTHTTLIAVSIMAILGSFVYARSAVCRRLVRSHPHLIINRLIRL